MADKQTKLSIVIDAQNKADKAFNETEQKLKGIGQTLDNLKPAFGTMAVAGGAAFAGISGFVLSSVKSFGEAQVATAKMTATLNAMGKNTDEVRKKIQDASASVIRLGFDDEAAAVSITKLYQATGDLNKAMEYNKLAMDLARAKGIDLETASLAITRALGGNVRALKEFVPELDETVSVTDALAMAQGRLAGQAEEAAKTIPIQMKALSESFSNVKDAIGSVFAPALTEALNKMLPIVQKLAEWAEQNPKTILTIVAVTLAVSGLVMGLGLLGLAVMGIMALMPALTAMYVFLTTAFVASLPIIALVVFAIGSIAFAAIKLMEVMKYTSEDWKMVWVGMKLTVAEWANAVVKIFETVINYIIDRINDGIKSINSLISSLAKIPKIGGVFKGFSIPTLDRVNFQGIDTDAIVAEAMTPKNASGNNIVVSGNTLLSEDAAEKIGDMIMSKLKLSNAI